MVGDLLRLQRSCLIVLAEECTPCDIGLDDPHELAAKACNDYEFGE